MKQKKLIALGLSLGMMLNSLSVSAAEYVEVNPQSEEQGDFSSQSEIEIEGEDFEEFCTVRSRNSRGRFERRIR